MKSKHTKMRPHFLHVGNIGGLASAVVTCVLRDTLSWRGGVLPRPAATACERRELQSGEAYSRVTRPVVATSTRRNSHWYDVNCEMFSFAVYMKTTCFRTTYGHIIIQSSTVVSMLVYRSYSYLKHPKLSVTTVFPRASRTFISCTWLYIYDKYRLLSIHTVITRVGQSVRTYVLTVD